MSIKRVNEGLISKKTLTMKEVINIHHYYNNDDEPSNTEQPLNSEADNRIEGLFQEISAYQINDELVQRLYSQLQNDDGQLTAQKMGDLKVRYSHFFDKIFVHIGTLPPAELTAQFDQNLFLIEKLGVKDDRAVLALFHQITGLEDSSENRAFLDEIKDETKEDEIYSILADYRANCEAKKVNPERHFKRKAMPVLIKLVQDTRALATIGYRCIEQYEDDVVIRKAAITVLEEYGCTLSTEFRAENPSIIHSLLKRTLADSNAAIRALGIGAMNAISQHVGHEVMNMLRKQQMTREEERIRLQLLDDLENNTLPVVLKIAVDAFCSCLFDAADKNRDNAIEKLFSLTNWELIIKYLPEADIDNLFLNLLKFFKLKNNQAVKKLFWSKIQAEEFSFVKLCRQDIKAEFCQRYKHELKPQGKSLLDLDEIISVLQRNAKRLIEALQQEIRSENGYYSEAIEAVNAITKIAGREDSSVRKFLIDIVKHFEFQGQTFGFVPKDLPCKGREKCPLHLRSMAGEKQAGDKTDDIPLNSFYYRYRKNNHYYYKTLYPECENVVLNMVLDEVVYAQRCPIGNLAQRGQFKKLKMSAEFLIDADRFLKSVNNKPALSATVIKSIRSDLKKTINQTITHSDWNRYLDFDDDIVRTVFRSVYLKQPTDEDIDRLLLQLVPERELITALFDTMKLLSVGDVATQAFLFELLGTDKRDFHWHENTRIKIIDTIAAITRGEPLPKYKNQQAIYVLSLIQARPDETKRVKEAVIKAREKINNRHEETGGEMMLAPEQPAGVVLRSESPQHQAQPIPEIQRISEINELKAKMLSVHPETYSNA
ncbi:MAG: hypothetical protein DRR19_01555 [Candidatus Parabeggiatoa sp. nov. 1]|nr:MAG: hypothetical protein DRR19_01555 [Gammaproteobacteria bacterium]